ncbi:thymidine kinase [Roseimaritima sediminicola]|uniref:hypothetical protein n=1 Tax=Roseimaritima sediminicola TaxID=2662066 RepID=UPI001F24C63E|nr:hypothetical protein [Roseimaritima sediminicola]
MPPAQPSPCRLCQRVTKLGTTEHHLIPRTCHRNRWFQKRFSREQMRQTISVCRDCHRAIHKLIPREKDLGRFHNTPESLLEHDELAKFVAWVRRRR